MAANTFKELVILRCVDTTPLGNPVLPDVYMSVASFRGIKERRMDEKQKEQQEEEKTQEIKRDKRDLVFV